MIFTNWLMYTTECVINLQNSTKQWIIHQSNYKTFQKIGFYLFVYYQSLNYIKLEFNMT